MKSGEIIITIKNECIMKIKSSIKKKFMNKLVDK